MNYTENGKKSVHQGKNAKRFREAKGIKQEVIAIELNITQQAVSQLEKRPELDDEIIITYARVVGIDELFIRNMVDDSLPGGITNYFDLDHCSQTLNFNPLDKVMELCEEKDELYERMLKEKDKVNNYLEKSLDKFSK